MLDQPQRIALLLLVAGAGLSDAQREVLLDRLLLDRSYNDLATERGVSYQRVNGLGSTAIQKLRGVVVRDRPGSLHVARLSP